MPAEPRGAEVAKVHRGFRAVISGLARKLVKQPRKAWRGLVRQKDAIDALNKIILTGVAVSAPFLVHILEKRMAGTTLLSQRELAESELRATMFGDLITPILGAKEAPRDPEREALLVELLALNFHEHIEIKPLLEQAYEDAASGDTAKATRIQKALRSVARRVKERQIALLFAEAHAAHVPIETWDVFLSDSIDRSIDPVNRRIQAGFGNSELIRLNSPDGGHTVIFYGDEPSWDDDHINIHLWVEGTSHEAHADFTLSSFDFPLTDNLRLDDGNRISCIDANGSGELREKKTFRLSVIWFPKGFSTAQERPLNLRDYQDLVGRKPN